MRKVIKKLLVPGLMLAALPLVAGAVGEDLAAGEMVKVVTQASHPAACLAAVAVTKIDGETRVVPAQGFLIEPGIHTINGRATLDSRYCPSINGDQQIGRAADLEVNFEAGKTYYIAYEHKSQNLEEWRLLVWKVELDNTVKTKSQ